jgi:hypothetical protein
MSISREPCRLGLARSSSPHALRLARSLLFSLQTTNGERQMGEFLPDYLIREQMAVGSLLAFGVLRVIAAAIGYGRGWRVSAIGQCCIGAALIYCAPQLFDVLAYAYEARVASAELEGKVAGCAIALFCAPIVSHKLGYE